VADEVLGIAAEDDPPNAPATMGPTYDEIRAPVCGFLTDLLARLIAHCFDKRGVHLDTSAVYRSLPLTEEEFPSTAQGVNNFA
jgi:hypothetical protein